MAARDGAHTIGSLADLFGAKSFALIFVLLLGVPALPLPTGGATHLVDVIAALLALQLIARRSTLWVPHRWSAIDLAGPRQQRFLDGLMRTIRFIERFSRLLAPPFTGLDTLPALGVVLLSLGSCSRTLPS